MMSLLKFIQSRLALIAKRSEYLVLAGAVFLVAANPTITTWAAYAVFTFAALGTCAHMCKAASKGVMSLYITMLVMPLVFTASVCSGAQIGLGLTQQTATTAEWSGLIQTMLTLMLVTTGYALFPAMFCLPINKGPLPPILNRRFYGEPP